jgi:hypothetical protein
MGKDDNRRTFKMKRKRAQAAKKLREKVKRTAGATTGRPAERRPASAPTTASRRVVR